MAESKVWLRFGRSMTELLLKNENRVVATLRNKEALSDLAEQYPSSQLLIVQTDVVNSSEVAAAFAKAREVFGRVDVVFNNAGALLMGAMESISDEEARKTFEVNFWGASNVTREAIRMFREVNKPVGGRLLQVSSLLGLVGKSGMSYYAASTIIAHTGFPALEGFSEGLAQELNPAWNIKVTIIEPGPFRTRMLTDDIHLGLANPELADSKPRQRVTLGDPEKAVAVIEKLTHLDEPPLRLPLHRNAIAAGREKVKSLNDDMDRYESWSENVYFT
ncbi:NAD(P)-binding protein [Suillus ampliporus]|nr:NAD(P)-binding protein [Suillus ampliporus]